MPTSGSTDWALTRDQIISSALRKLGVLASGQSPTTNQVNDASMALNGLVKALQADGMPLWKITTHTFATVADTSSYTIGVGQTLNVPAPLKVIKATYNRDGSHEVPMNIETRYDFFNMPGTSEGTPVTLHYQPLRNTGIIRLWPIPQDALTNITIHYQTMYEDFDGASDDADFPSYWHTAIIYNLAWLLAPEYGIPPSDRNILSKEAMYWKEQALSFGSEEGSLYISPNTRE